MALHECNIRTMLPVEQRGMGSAGVMLGAVFDDSELQSLVYDNPNTVVLTPELFAALTSHSSPQLSGPQTLFPLTPAPSPLAFNTSHHHFGARPHASPRIMPVPIKCKSEPEPVEQKSPLLPSASSEMSDSSSAAAKKARKRRSFKELVRDIACKHDGCGRVYATESSLQTHIRLKHQNMRAAGEAAYPATEPEASEPRIKEGAPKKRPAKDKGEHSAARRPRTKSMPATSSKSQMLHIPEAVKLETETPLRSLSEPCWGIMGLGLDDGGLSDFSHHSSDALPATGSDLFLNMALGTLDFSLDDVDLAAICADVGDILNGL